jgi:hypothetical protein
MPNPEKIECSICKKRFPADTDKEKLVLHVMAEHPLDLITHPTVVKNMSAAAIKAGATLADLMQGGVK